MTIIRDDSQQTTASLSVTTENGERRQVASANCHIRPGKGVSINVDVLDGTLITNENRAELCAAITQYISEELAKATALGVPVAPTGT